MAMGSHNYFIFFLLVELFFWFLFLILIALIVFHLSRSDLEPGKVRILLFAFLQFIVSDTS